MARAKSPEAKPGWRGATIQGLIFQNSVKIWHQTKGTWKVRNIFFLNTKVHIRQYITEVDGATAL